MQRTVEPRNPQGGEVHDSPRLPGEIQAMRGFGGRDDSLREVSLPAILRRRQAWHRHQARQSSSSKLLRHCVDKPGTEGTPEAQHPIQRGGQRSNWCPGGTCLTTAAGRTGTGTTR